MFGAKLSRQATLLGIALLWTAATDRCLSQQRQVVIPRVTSLADLKALSPEQLQALYGISPAGRHPVGYLRGEVLYLDKTLLPRTKILVAGVIWRGKYFDENSGFVNQWTAFRAIASQTQLGPSYYDARPALILEYSNLIPYFGAMRDEIREVAPGVYLAMVFPKNDPHRMRGFIGLELEAPKDPSSLKGLQNLFGR